MKNFGFTLIFNDLKHQEETHHRVCLSHWTSEIFTVFFLTCSCCYRCLLHPYNMPHGVKLRKKKKSVAVFCQVYKPHRLWWFKSSSWVLVPTGGPATTQCSVPARQAGGGWGPSLTPWVLILARKVGLAVRVAWSVLLAGWRCRETHVLIAPPGTFMWSVPRCELRTQSFCEITSFGDFIKWMETIRQRDVKCL